MKKYCFTALLCLLLILISCAHDRAITFYDRGLKYHNASDPDSAIESFTKAIEFHPGFDMAYYRRGLVYHDIGDLENAIADYTKAVSLNPFNFRAFEKRGEAYNAIGETEKGSADLARAAAVNLNRSESSSRSSDDAEFYFQRGNEYYISGDLDNAIADYTQAIALNQNYYEAYTNRGGAYFVKSELDLAIADFTQAISINPNLAEAYHNRGLMYFNKDELDMAIADYNKVIALNPNLAGAYNNRGGAYSKKGEQDRAIEDYSMAISLNANDDNSLVNRGLVYFEKRDMDKAIDDFNNAILINPNNARTWNYRGLAHYFIGEFNKAIDDYSKAIEIDAQDPLIIHNRGLLYNNLGMIDQALDDYNKAIELSPNEAVYWNNRGIIYGSKGDYDQAIYDFSRAIEIDPNYASAFYNRGDAHRSKFNRTNAIEDYRKTIEAADFNRNILDIFNYSWAFVGNVYNQYPYLTALSDPLFGFSLVFNLETGEVFHAIPEELIDTLNDFNFEKSYSDIARESIARSINKAENIRFNFGSRGTEVMTSLIYQYYAGVDFEATIGSAETAFSYSESLRSRGFLEQMGTETALKLPGIEPEDAQRVRRLLREIDNYQNLLIGINPQMEAKRYAQTGLALSNAEEMLSILDNKISSQNPLYMNLRKPTPVNLEKAQEYCSVDSVIFEYVIWDSSVEFKAPNTTYGQSFIPDRPSINSYCLVITKDNITPVRLDPHFDYAASVNELRDFVIDRAGLVQMEPSRNALYNALIKPALPYIPQGIKHILIVPDGPLGHLPFDILRENASSEDFGVSYRLSFSPSVSVSILAREIGVDSYEPVIAFGDAWYNDSNIGRDRGTRNLQIADNAANSRPSQRFWDNLPGTKIEVQNLSSFVSSPGQIRTLTGGEVSEENVKRLSDTGELSKYSIVHFACHGYFDESDPARSGIVLSEVSGALNNEEDGYLTIPEIVLLNLKTKMVLLSACETGLAQVKRGDGMVGMARAFMVAGAETVGVSLWSIDDDGTEVFMSKLYQKVLKEGLPFNEAYYQVKKELREDPTWEHPYFWAAFMLYM